MVVLRALVLGCLALTLLTPLIAVPSRFVFGFVVPRVLLLQAVVGVLLGCWALLRWRSLTAAACWRSPVTWAGALWLVSLGLSTAFGVDARRSVWDTYERMVGLVALLHVAALYLVATSEVRTPRMWRAFLHGVLAVGVAVAGVALAQKVDPQVFGNQGSPRVVSTLGHPAYLGAHGLFVAAVAALLFTRERAVLFRAWTVAAGGLGVVSAVVSETRGTLLGLGVGVLVALALWSFAAEQKRSRRIARALLVGAAAATAAMLPLIGLEGQIRSLEHELMRDRAGVFLRWHAAGLQADHDPVELHAELAAEEDAELAPVLTELAEQASKEGSALAPITANQLRDLHPLVLTAANRGRAASADSGFERRLARKRAIYDLAYSVPGLRRFVRATVTAKTASTRLANWRSALDATRERPVLGWGPNNYFHAHNAHYRPELLSHGFASTWIDDAHNVYLNTLAEQGLFGLVALLALLVVPVVVLWRARRSGRVDLGLAVVVTAYLGARAVHNAFVFDDATSFVNLAWLLALVASTTTVQRTAATPGDRPPGPAIAVTALLVTGLVYLTGIRPARDALVVDDMLLATVELDAERALDRLDRCLAVDSPRADEARWLFGAQVAALGRAVRSAPPTSLEPYLTLARRACAEFERALEPPRLHPRAAVHRADLADNLAVLARDSRYLEGAEAALVRARTHSPRRQELMFEQADLWMLLQRPADEVIALLEHAVGLAPSVGTSWVCLAEAHARRRDTDAARRVLTEAIERGVTFRAHEQTFVDGLLEDEVVGR